jgi:glycosyltransferase involved in cell wall biosynthesis
LVNILYITYDGLTDPLGQSQILPYIIGLCKKNPEYQFHIISFEKKKRYIKERKLIENIIESYNIHWHPLVFSHGKVMKILDLVKLYRCAIKLNNKLKFDVVHARSYVSSLLAIYLKKQNNNIKYIFDMRGFWVDERIDGGIWNIKNPLYILLYKYFKNKEKQFLKNADAIVSLTEKAKQEMLNWGISNLTNKKIHVIPCAADFEHFNPDKITDRQKKELRKKLNIKENDFVLSYLGSIGTWYLLDEMLEFFKILLHTNSNSVFLFITKENKSIILDSANKLNINTDKIKIISAERKEVPGYLSISNFNISFIKNAYSKFASSPTKLGEVLALGIPVICNNIGDVKNIITLTNSGVCINNLNKEEFKNIIEKNIINPKNFNQQEIRDKSFNYYNLNNAIDKYNETYKLILNKSTL